MSRTKKRQKTFTTDYTDNTDKKNRFVFNPCDPCNPWLLSSDEDSHMASEIVIVSGLPRSGTSLMMQMLDNGGVEVVTDNVRAADTDNPKGYYEFEQVKAIKRDTSWLPATRGRAFKMVSQLLYDLPAGETYRIIFMERD